MTSDPGSTANNQIIKEFYRKTKLIQKNQVKTIWEATHIYTGDVVVAKVQTLNQSVNQRTVLHEGKFLQSCQGSPGIPFLVWCGKDESQRQGILIEQKLGKTLSQIMSQSQKLSLKSVLMIGIQLMKIMACYHEKGYIHRNINLETIQFGTGSRCDKVYFNDFIESRSFYKKNTLQHIDRKTGIKVKKATQFSSYDMLDGVQPSRKDDIESIMLVLICLLKGKLPWSEVWRSKKNKNNKNFYSQKFDYISQRSQQKIIIQNDLTNKNKKNKSQNKLNTNSIQNKSKQELEAHKEIKDFIYEIFNDPKLEDWKIQKRIEATKSIMELFTSQKLCAQLPKEIVQIYLQVKNLEFTQKPNYLSYTQRFNAILIKQDLQNDGIFDWMRFKNISKSISQGGLSIKQYEWLIRGKDKKSKLVELPNEEQTLAIYEKMAPFIQIDKLGGL